MVALLPTLWMPAVSAQPEDTFRSEIYIELNWTWIGFAEEPGYPWGLPIVHEEYTWIGWVSGDINGDLYVALVAATFPGKTEHFAEIWRVETDAGVIEGFDVGVWSFINWKFMANGKVTGATGAWSYLEGYDMHYRGTTTNPDVAPPTLLSGTGIMILSSK
jgi:hypothetical protein